MELSNTTNNKQVFPAPESEELSEATLGCLWGGATTATEVKGDGTAASASASADLPTASTTLRFQLTGEMGLIGE